MVRDDWLGKVHRSLPLDSEQFRLAGMLERTFFAIWGFRCTQVCSQIHERLVVITRMPYWQVLSRQLPQVVFSSCGTGILANIEVTRQNSAYIAIQRGLIAAKSN
jgi:hypothetical protein